MKIRNGHNQIWTVSRYSYWPKLGRCTGCARSEAACVCGRTNLNRCVACRKKLWEREGRKVLWGAALREVCKACTALMPSTVLVGCGPNNQ